MNSSIPSYSEDIIEAAAQNSSAVSNDGTIISNDNNGMVIVRYNVDETFEEDGLQLNPDKCKIVSKEWLQDAAYTLVQDGLVMLGTPVGFGDYAQRKSVELLTKKLDSLPALRAINPHCAIRLLDRCVNQRVQYTCPAPQVAIPAPAPGADNRVPSLL